MLLLVACLAFLLASFPARNSDLWAHLAAGRHLAGGDPSSSPAPGPGPSSTWLYDFSSYGLFRVLGGPGLVLAKALLVAGLAVVLLRLSRTGRGWWVPAFCTALALLAMSTRLLLQPATVSYLLLGLSLWSALGRPDAGRRQSAAGWLPPWPLAVLFVVWVNLDRWFVLGLGAVALVWLGQTLDEALGARGPRGGWPASLLRRGCALALLMAVCLLNPAHVYAFTLPPELGSLMSPFQGTYFAIVGVTPASLAYFPLLGLGLLSFGLNLPRWHWRRFLPWLGLAVVSALQARAVPFFAVVGGPVLAWNLQDYFARGSDAAGEEALIWRRNMRAGHVLTGVLLVVLPVCAWPGWLQVPPFEPRRWALEVPPSLEKGAAVTGRELRERKLGPDARGLYLSAETAHAFAWFCPEERGLWDAQLAAAVRGDPDAPADRDERMRAAGINHVVLYDPDAGRLCATMDRLSEDPRQWPLLYVEGYLAVFGWRDPAAAGATDPFEGKQLDLRHLAFHPAPDKKAPPQATGPRATTPSLWEPFWNPVLPRPIDQDEATLHLFHAEALRRTAPVGHLDAWQRSQAAALVSAAGSWAGGAPPAPWVGAVLDARLRLTLLQPRTPEPGSGYEALSIPDQLALALQQQFSLQRDDTSPALLYLAVRAARRALAAKPDDAQAYLVLGESYLRLLHSTRERVWGDQMTELIQLRRAQASAALNQAASLKPDFAQAHLSLSRLYGEMGYLDLTLEHLRTYVELSHKAGPPRGVSPVEFRELEAPFEQELSQLAKEVEKRENRYEVASAGLNVFNRARKAGQEGLAGKARDLLLESDVTAFGPQGMAMELELLLRTGRPKDVWEWTGPEQEAALGTSYHWVRAQALAALGDYALAQEECGRLSQMLAAGPQGQEPVPFREIIAMLAANRVLDEQPGTGSLFDLLRRARSRSEFYDRVTGLAQRLRREADVTVLQGLLALEEGEADEAEIAFREALSYWEDAAAAASGGGLDFNGRPVAHGYLEWLE